MGVDEHEPADEPGPAGERAPLEERIGYRFVDDELRRQALTHSSFGHESGVDPRLDNERLEFLGDSILGFLVAEILFERFRDRREGDLTRLRAQLVSARTLADKARQLGLGPDLRLGRGEERSGGRDKESILSDAYESLVAALFLDGGLDAARRFVVREFGPELDHLPRVSPLRDAKTELQEWVHGRGLGGPEYRVTDETGPDHRKRFEVSVLVDGAEVGRGQGGNKKTAQQEAARAALARLLAG